MCWLRQRDTYPATIVAPLSKGDAVAVPLVYTFIILGKGQTGCYRASPFERGTAEPGGMYWETDVESPFIFLKRTFAICAGSASVKHTPPLSWHPFRKGDAGAVTFVSIFSILSKRQTDCYRASPFERGTAEPGGMYRKTDVESPFII